MQNTTPVQIEREAGYYYRLGCYLKRMEKYDASINNFDRAAALYNILASQTDIPEKKKEYLERLRDCLQPLAVATFFPDFITAKGLEPWKKVIKMLVETSKELAELEKIVREQN